MRVESSQRISVSLGALLCRLRRSIRATTRPAISAPAATPRPNSKKLPFALHKTWPHLTIWRIPSCDGSTNKTVNVPPSGLHRSSPYALALSLCLVGCGSSPTSPTPPAPTPAASLASSGNLAVTACTPSTGNLFSCFSYSGTATNSGSGCATHLNGVTTSYDATTRTQVGNSGWSYASTVRPGETISYTGFSLLVTGPLTGGWFYTTTIAWDNVKCP